MCSTTVIYIGRRGYSPEIRFIFSTIFGTFFDPKANAVPNLATIRRALLRLGSHSGPAQPFVVQRTKSFVVQRTKSFVHLFSLAPASQLPCAAISYIYVAFLGITPLLLSREIFRF
jgi:hypothetical protein